MTDPAGNSSLARSTTWVDRHPRSALATLIAFYLSIVLTQSCLKLIWADELITFYIARQPGFSGVWSALRAGADPNPPLMHLLVKASTALTGPSPFGMRLPAILGVLVAILAMWWMLRRWLRPVFALIGILAYMATRGFDYAYDARSYAPMMGFAMAALALWIAASDRSGIRRQTALAAMALALAAGISTNYYGVLAFFPIAAGEAFRSLQSRRLRLDLWLWLTAATLPLLAFLPLIRHNIAEFGPHAWNRPQLSMVGMSYLELIEGIFWPVLALVLYALWHRRGNWSIPQPDAIAVAVLLLFPFLGFAIAVAGAGMISPRCVVPVCCGAGLAAGIFSQRVFGRSLRAPILLVALLVVWVTAREAVCANLLLQQRQAFFALRSQSAQAGPGQIIVGDSSFVLPLYFYSPEEVRRRIVFPIDFSAIHRFERDDSGEQNLWAGRNGVFPFQIAPLKPGSSLQPGDVLIARPDGWLATAISPGGSQLALIGLDSHGLDSQWSRLGGVFTPMGHAETRILAIRPNPR